MGMSDIKCHLGFPTAPSSALTVRLEAQCTTMDSSYGASYLAWRTGLRTLHDAVDAALSGDQARTANLLTEGQEHLAACGSELTTLGRALVELRSELFERAPVDLAEPLIAREPFFTVLDYDGIHRELAGGGAALPGRVFWDEVVERVREGGARGACRLLERHVRELQSDLHRFMAQVECAKPLPLRQMAEALHGMSIPVGRVTTGFTRLVTTCGYVSIICERTSQAFEDSLQAHVEARAAS